MFPDDQIVDDAYAVHYGRAQPFDSCMQDQTAGYFTAEPIDQSPVESWYGTTNPYPQPLYPEHMGYDVSLSGIYLVPPDLIRSLKAFHPARGG